MPVEKKPKDAPEPKVVATAYAHLQRRKEEGGRTRSMHEIIRLTVLEDGSLRASEPVYSNEDVRIVRERLRMYNEGPEVLP